MVKYNTQHTTGKVPGSRKGAVGGRGNLARAQISYEPCFCRVSPPKAFIPAVLLLPHGQHLGYYFLPENLAYPSCLTYCMEGSWAESQCIPCDGMSPATSHIWLWPLGKSDTHTHTKVILWLYSNVPCLSVFVEARGHLESLPLT